MTTKTALVQARIEPELKSRAEAILNALKIRPSEAISMFYNQIVLKRGLPFEVRIPNAVTQKTVEDIENGIGLKKFEDFEDFVKELDH
ncbi:MAG: type II toxin-antitoxin system RelB/DinJ family antitoxin [bacterium]